MIVSFPLEEDPNVAIIAWTTTPWTLPSNMACCVHPDLIYVKVKGQYKKNMFAKVQILLGLFRKFIIKSYTQYTYLL